MSGDQQTNQPTPTTQDDKTRLLWFESDYLSVRITVEHEHVDRIKNMFDDYNWCIYMHKHGTANEHFHIALPDAKSEAIRNRIKRAWSNIQHLGNKFYSIKSYKNGLRGFVFYCHHEGAEPVFKHTQTWDPIISDVVNHGAYKKHDKMPSGTIQKVRERLSNPQLTMSNLLRQTAKYANEHELRTTDIGVVCRHMVNDGWDPDYGLISKGIPTEYYEIFAARMKKKPVEDMEWMKPHKRKERISDLPEVDTDYQSTKRTNILRPMV